jgi:ATP-binding cassette subfamily B protein
MTSPTLEPERIPVLKRAFVQRILRELQPYWARLAFTTLFILLGTVFTVIQPLILRSLIDEAGRRSNDMLRLGTIAGFLVLLPVLAALLGVIQRRITGAISADMQFDLRNRIYAHLQKLPYRMYVHSPPGEFNNRLSVDTQQTNQMILRTLPDATSNALRLVGSFIAMFSLEWRLTLAALAILPLAAWIARKRNYATRKVNLHTMQVHSALGLQVGETTQASGIMNMRLFDRGPYELERNKTLSNQVREAELLNNNLMAGNIVSSSVIIAIGTALVYAIGGLLVFSGNFTLGAVVAFVAYLNGLYTALQSLMSLPQSMALALIGYERIFELLDLPLEDPGPTRADLPKRANGNLCFENVTFQFDDEVPLRATARPWSINLMGQSGTAQSDRPQANALENIQFSVSPGHMIAIVGPSGAGKSTIFNLIPRFYDPNLGQITLDGQDLRNLPLEWLRKQISLVSQGIHIIPGTLADNLRYAQPNANDTSLHNALKAANLYEWAISLPHGLDTFMGQSGARLSGGERQRLAIARALLKDTPILLLDEATSHLDSINEEALQDALFRIRQNRSTLVIAHRLSTVHDANEILVLDHGKVRERGTHQTLLAHNGLYAQLYKTQFITEKRADVS